MTAVISFTFLFVSLLLGAAHSKPKICTLKVFDENSNDPMEGICLLEFETSDCMGFVQSFNRTDLPEDFALTAHDDSVGKPGSITLTSKLSPYHQKRTNKDFLIPGLLIDWSSPIDSSSRKNIKGYLLVMIEPDKVFCRMFKFNTTDENQLKKKLRLQYNFEYLKGALQYGIKVYSLPVPEDLEDSQRESAFVASSITTGSVVKDYNNPGDWIPSLSATNLRNGTLKVKIGPSPAIFNFTRFEVQVVKHSFDLLNAYRTKNFTQTPGTNTEGVVFFHNLEPDMYKAVVHVEDTFKGIPGKCLCFETEVTGKHCKLNCGSVQTQYVNVTGGGTGSDSAGTTSQDGQPGPVENTTEQHVEHSSSKLGESSSSLTGLIVGLILAVVVVAILAIVGYIWCGRRRQKNKFLVSSSDSKDTKPGPLQLEPSPKGDVGQLETKIIFIVSCEDSPAHVNYVEALAKFLKAHCMCHVFFPPWENIGSQYQNWMDWSRSTLSVANYVLLVDSAAVESHLACYNRTRAFINAPNHCNRTDEIFKLTRQNFVLYPEAQEKIIMAYYRERCGSLDYFQVPTAVKLPEAFPDLLRKIHGLGEEDTTAYSSCLPLSSKHYEKVEGGISFDLISTLEAVRGTPLMRLTSEVSAESGIVSDLDDVSNRNSFGSDQGSLNGETVELEGLGSPQTPVSKDKPSLFTINEDQSIFTIAEDQSIYTVADNPLNGDNNSDCFKGSSFLSENKAELDKEIFIPPQLCLPPALDANKLSREQDKFHLLGSSSNAAEIENNHQGLIPPQFCVPQKSMSTFQDAVFDINSMTGSTFDV